MAESIAYPPLLKCAVGQAFFADCLKTGFVVGTNALNNPTLYAFTGAKATHPGNSLYWLTINQATGQATGTPVALNQYNSDTVQVFKHSTKASLPGDSNQFFRVTEGPMFTLFDEVAFNWLSLSVAGPFVPGPFFIHDTGNPSFPIGGGYFVLRSGADPGSALLNFGGTTAGVAALARAAYAAGAACLLAVTVSDDANSGGYTLAPPVITPSAPSFTSGISSITVTITAPDISYQGSGNSGLVGSVKYSLNNGPWLTYSSPITLARADYQFGCTVKAYSIGAGSGIANSTKASLLIGGNLGSVSNVSGEYVLGEALDTLNYTTFRSVF